MFSEATFAALEASQAAAVLVAREQAIAAEFAEDATFRSVALHPIFRPRFPKPYFPAPGPVKTGRGRV